MYPVTRTVADNFKTNALQYLSILVNPVMGSSFEMTSADILTNGLSINRYSASGESINIGSCVAAELTLKLENGDGRFNSVVFEGAQLTVSIGIMNGNNVAWIPLGQFTVDNAPRRLAVINISALDGMVQFDKTVNRSALNLPSSVKNLVIACCSECNVTLETDLDSLPNADHMVNEIPETDDLTYRSILSWASQLMGVCGYMDWQGHLVLSFYKKDGIPETVSGSIATFESVTEVPVSHLVVNLAPKQEGIPAPDNICPITGNTDVSVTRAGENLFKKNGTGSTSQGITRTDNLDGSMQFSGTFTGTTGDAGFQIMNGVWLPVGTYTFSGVPSGGGSTTYRARVNRGEWNGTTIGYDSGNGITFTLTEADYVFVRMLVYRAMGTVDITVFPQLEIGSESTAYTPYTSDTYSIPLGQTVYGGTLDVTTGLLTVSNELLIMDGTSTNKRFTGKASISGINEYYMTWSRISTLGYPASSYPTTEEMNNAHFLCNWAPVKYASSAMNETLARLSTGSSGNGQIRLRFASTFPTSITTYQEANTWLASMYTNGTPVVFCYPLATPEVYQLTPAQVSLIKGSNNIWADSSTVSVTFPMVTEITPADRYNSDIYENAVTITGIQVKGKENTALYGSDDYAFNIEGNNLITDDDCETIANNLANLVGFSYHPFSASVLPMPYLYPLDMVAVEYKGEWYDCALTEVNLVSSAPTQLKGTGESAQSKSYARINPLTNRERAIIESVKAEVNTTLNKAINQVIDFNQIISNALGLYHTNVSDGAGGFIRYLHDAPDIESSTYIVTETAQGFAWTTGGWNGGSPVWTYGVTSGGYALFKWLSAEGIDVTKASSDYRAEVTPERFNIYYKNDLVITIDATDRAIKTPRLVIPFSSTSNNSLRVGQLVWIPTSNGANAVVLGG